MLAEYIYTGQQSGFKSLNDTLSSYGLPVKKDIVAEYWEQGISTESIPYSVVEEYNNWDVETTRLLYWTQLKLLSERQQSLVYLSGQDLLTLQAAEYAGIKFDVEEADRVLSDNRRVVNDCTKFLAGFLPTFPDGFVFNWDSGDHLSAFLYGGTLTYNHADPEERIYKTGPNKGQTYIRNKWTEFKIVFDQLFLPLEDTEVAKSKDKDNVPKFYQTDEPTLLQLKGRTKTHKEILDALRKRAAHTKIVEMCESVINKMKEKNWVDDYIHGQFNQVAVITGRLSSSGPNLQNTPPEIDKLLVSRFAN
jgi:DNA polymerase I-like protein with 3'-5' exonuclease and polymerase domains